MPQAMRAKLQLRTAGQCQRRVTIVTMQYACAAITALYIAIATTQGLALWRTPSYRIAPWLATLGVLAILGNAAALWWQVATPAGPALGSIAALSLFLCASCAVALAYSRLRPSVDRLLLVLYPLAALALALMAAVPSEQPPYAWPGGLPLHITLSALAFALLGIASLQLLCLRHLEGRLKQHRLGGLLPYLPPLQSQREIADQALILGTGLLLAALLSGALFLPQGLVADGHLAWKSLCSVIALTLYGTLLLLRRHHHIGRLSDALMISGFSCLLVGYFGSRLGISL